MLFSYNGKYNQCTNTYLCIIGESTSKVLLSFVLGLYDFIQ